MPITVEVPEVGLIDFPDEFSEDQISQALAAEPWKALGGAQAKGVGVPEQASPAPPRALAVPPFVPSPEFISTEQAEQEEIPEGVPTYQTMGEALHRPLVNLPKVTGRELELTRIPELVAGAAFRSPLAVNIARQTEKTSAAVLAGLQQATVGATEFFLSPIGIATLGSSRLPDLAKKGVAGYFVYQMAKQSPEMVKELAEAWYANDPERLSNAAASLGLNTAFIAGGAKAIASRATAPAAPKPRAELFGPENRPPPIESAKGEIPAAISEITPAESARVKRINTALEQQRETTPELKQEPIPAEQPPSQPKPPPSAGEDVPAKGAPAGASSRPMRITMQRLQVYVEDGTPAEAQALANERGRTVVQYDSATRDEIGTYKPQPPAKPAAKEAVAPVAEAKAGAETSVRTSLSEEGLSEQQVLDLLSKKKTPEEVVSENLSKFERSGEYQAPGTEGRGFVTPEGDLIGIGGFKHESALQMAYETGVQRIRDILSKQVTPQIIERINARDRRDWSKLPSSFETDAVRAAFSEIKELFPKRAISQRVRASKATTFSELREAVDSALKPKPTRTTAGEGQENIASDWTSATQDKPPGIKIKLGEKGESGFVHVPRFPNRKMSELDKVTTQHSGKLQKSMDEARRAQREIKREVPSERRQSAISVWREAKGDAATLQAWAAAAKGKVFKQAATDAQSLTPKEIAIANKAGAAFDALHQRGTRYDVLKSFRDDYVPHVWDVKRPGSGFGSGILQQRFRFSKARTFATFFEGDQAGYKPKTLAIGRLLPAYLHEMNKVIADRQAVQDFLQGNASDKRPLVTQRGNVQAVDNPQGKAVLVSPRALRDVDTSDYRTMENQPALHDWIWEGKDTDGKPVFVKADLALHPEAYRRLNSMLGQSAIRTWYRDPVGGTAQIPRAIAQGLDTAQAAMKREMFGLLAPFHQVQEGTHAIGHLVNPFFGVPKIDFRNPAQLDAANHGLMLLPDRASSRTYLEGVGTKTSLLSRGIRKIPKAGEAVSDVIDGYQDYLFHQYIPGLKLKTYEAMVRRNTKLYARELASGEMTVADVKITSAEQANAAYGHLNYALLDRNPTMQHIIQMAALAPDFLEARARFAGQAVKGLNSKVGHEQLKAVAIIAAAQAGAAFVLSNLLGSPYDPRHPFEVIHKGRRYAMRSVPEDIYSLLKDTRQFIYGRVNPLTAKGGIQFLTGLNYRGEKTTPLETFTELLAGYIPITARSLPGIRSLTESGRQNPVTPLQQLAGSLGLRISRYSPISESYKLAAEWMDTQKLARDKGSYPVSKYQQLRYALEDGDLDRAKEEYLKLRTTMAADKIASGFRQSMNHPFTGSAANDKQFAASLKGYNRQLYDYALTLRKQITASFNALPK